MSDPRSAGLAETPVEDDRVIAALWAELMARPSGTAREILDATCERVKAMEQEQRVPLLSRIRAGLARRWRRT